MSATKLKDMIDKAPEVEIEPPRPLQRPLEPADLFSIEALGSVLGSAARAIVDQVQCPGAIAGQSVLAVATLAVQGHADIELPHGKPAPGRPAVSGARRAAARAARLRQVRVQHPWHPPARHQALLIESNSAANLGGGIYNDGGSLWVFETQFSENASGGSGGGISSWLGTTTVMRSSFDDNSATGLTGLGGAIHFYGLAPSSELRVGNTTFSQNSAQWAGGVVTTSTNTTATMNNVTMVDNTSTMGAQEISVSGTFELSNSIVTHLNGLGFAPSCTAVVPISGQNYLMDAPCPNVGGNWVGPLLAGSLGALANHGGPTLSYILLAGSNGIDTGVNDCPDPLTGNPLRRINARSLGLSGPLAISEPWSSKALNA
jgi:hypothetical protein